LFCVEVKVGKIAAAVIASLMVALIALYARAQTPQQEQAAQDMRDARSVAERHRAELMKIPHVKLVTGEVDSRNEAAILIEVDKQKNVDEVMRKAPSQIEGFPVEVDLEAPETASGAVHADSRDSDGGNPRRFPTIDKDGHYHHVWLKPATPAATP
jgi:hypothetical protein